MILDVQQSYNARIITPVSVNSKPYYVLFRKSGVKGPFLVTESSLQVQNSLIYVGDLKPIKSDEVVGNLFYTQANVVCNGSVLLAYSGLFKTSVNYRMPLDFKIDLMVNTPDLQLFMQRNKATMVVSPSLKKAIRENLEI